MVISLTFCLNAAFNFILAFAVATVLGPEEFGHFAIGSMVAIVVSTAFFDWLRLSVTRRYNDTSRATDPALRATLNVIYLGGMAAIVAVGCIVRLLGFHLGLSPAMIAAIVAASIATGQFEYWTALARARFLNGTYAKLVMTKNLLAFVMMIGAARVYHSATAVLIAVTLSIVLSVLPVWRALHDPGMRLMDWRRERVGGFARYGVPIVAGNVIFQLILLLNRWIASTHFGYAEAGQLSFSTDLGIRLLVAVGAGFDVLLFQLAVRQEALHGKAAAQSQMARNMPIIAAALVPLAAGYLATLPAFTGLFVPPQYRVEFATISLYLLPGILAYSLTQFVIGPVFQIEGRTAPMVYAAGSALLTDVVLLSLLPRDSGPASIAFAHSMSFLVAFTVAGLLASRARACWPPLRDFASIGVATALMTLIIWPMRSFAQPWLAFVTAVGIGIPVYVVLLVVLDVAGLRERAGAWLLARRGAAQPTIGRVEIRDLKAH